MHLERPTSVKPLAAAAAALMLVGLALPACAGEGKSAAAKAAPAPAATQNVAEIDGQPVTMTELEQMVSAQLAQIDKQRRQILEQSLDGLVEEKLIEREATARSVTKDQLVASEITSKVVEVTDPEVDAWYEANKARVGNRPKDQIAPQIKAYLGNERAMKIRGDFLAGLRSKYKVKLLLEPYRLDVPAVGPAKGPDTAPVTIVEFSDFECPFCSRVTPTLTQVHDTYGDKVRIVFRNFPLPIHPSAPKAAEAAACAFELGKFWEMHDAMFADQKGLAIDGLKAKAAAVGLDAAKFDECLTSGRMASKVQADLEAGRAAGVNGTPAFFINGRDLSGAVPFEQFKQLIDDELARKGVATK